MLLPKNLVFLLITLIANTANAWWCVDARNQEPSSCFESPGDIEEFLEILTGDADSSNYPTW